MGSVRYPDAFVTCGPIPRGSTVVRDPVVIFEVLSQGTAHTDRMTKIRGYAAFERVGSDWLERILAAEAVIHMPEIGIEMLWAGVYEGLDLSGFLADEDG